FTGNGPFLHDDPRDRPMAIYGGETTIHLGGGKENFLLLPIIPEKVAVTQPRPSSRSGKAMLDEGVAAHRRRKAHRAAKRRRPRAEARRPAPATRARRKWPHCVAAYGGKAKRADRA